MLISQLRKGETLYFIDLDKIEEGIKEAILVSNEYSHTDDTGYGCGCAIPEDVWEITFECPNYGERSFKIFSFNENYISYEYNGMTQDNEKLRKIFLRISADDNLLIQNVKNEYESYLNQFKSKKQALEIELSMINSKINNVNKALEKLKKI